MRAKKMLFLLGFLIQALYAERMVFDSDVLIEHVQKSLVHAERCESKLTYPILNIAGMTGLNVRHFLNNLCSLQGASYLEIGCYRGSTFVASNFGNQDALSSSIAIDNWSEFGNVRKKFHHNISRYLDRSRVKILENDCFAVDIHQSITDPITIYLYDGHHSKESHTAAFTYYNAVLSPVFITVVDDWNWEGVRSGTRDAFKQLNYEILFEKEIFTTFTDALTWWNGIYVAVISRPAI